MSGLLVGSRSRTMQSLLDPVFNQARRDVKTCPRCRGVAEKILLHAMSCGSGCKRGRFCAGHRILIVDRHFRIRW
jgi:hypothetical protein